MAKHINNRGQFQSDKYPDLAPDKLILSFRDTEARSALKLFAETTKHKDLAESITERLTTILGE
ncbi:hypothetical protein HYW58_02090 [Candidatus Kaiserbacteria bacterium]|nr:hypothetical protein [Candidatus Kaiserbacteria bacterium]